MPGGSGLPEVYPLDGDELVDELPGAPTDRAHRRPKQATLDKAFRYADLYHEELRKHPGLTPDAFAEARGFAGRTMRTYLSYERTYRQT
jgi:hypothetical protein